MGKLKNKILFSDYISSIKFDLTESGSFVLYNNIGNSFPADITAPKAIVFNKSFVAVDFYNGTRKIIVNF